MTPRQALYELATAVNHSGFTPDVEDLYSRECSGYDARDVHAACRHIARKSQWWPKLAELIAEIGQQRQSRVKLTAGADDPAVTVKCLDCDDTHWNILRCDGPPERRCGRSEQKSEVPCLDSDGKTRTATQGGCRGPHTYASRCECWHRKKRLYGPVASA